MNRIMIILKSLVTGGSDYVLCLNWRQGLIVSISFGLSFAVTLIESLRNLGAFWRFSELIVIQVYGGIVIV